MAINTAGLSGWPSPALLNAGAAAIRDAGPKLENAVAGLSSQWNGLQAVYQAPEVETVLGVFSNITPHGEFVSSASEQAANALRDFAAGIEALQATRAELLGDIGEHNAFVNSDACTKEDEAEAANNSALLQARVEQLTAQILQLEENCVAALGSATGETNPFVDAATSELGGLGLATLELMAGSVDNQSRPLWPGGPRSYFDLRPEPHEFRQRNSQSYRDFVANNPDRFIGQAGGWAKIARGGGPILSIAGAGLTYGSKYEEEYNRLLQENPGMSEEDRVARAREVGVARTTTNVAAGLAAGYAGATIGSFCGPVGTIVGFGIGWGLSTLADTDLEILGGRSLTDAVGDGFIYALDWVRGPGLDLAEQAGEWAGDFADDAAENIGDFMGDAAENAREIADDAAENAREIADDAADRVRDTARNILGAFGR